MINLKYKKIEEKIMDIKEAKETLIKNLEIINKLWREL